VKALLLAAGLGTRLRPLTETVPKCLVPIHGKPLLDYWLDLLFEQDIIERVLVNTGHLAPALGRTVSIWSTRNSCWGPAARCWPTATISAIRLA